MVLVIGLVAWVALGTSGLFALTAHGAAAGRPANAPAELSPTEDPSSSLRRTGRATLVVVAHPACPCTRATLHELERVLGSVGGTERIDVVVLFTGPRRGDARADRIAGQLRALAGAIPGARIVDDPGGVEASRLGAFTSGTVLFYDHAGSLHFNGGITPGRGHEGDSAGGDALRALLLRETSRETRADGAPVPNGAAPVFGCALADGVTQR